VERPKTTKNVGQPCVICGQSADAQATIAALQADNRTYINERHENMKQIEQLQAQVKELEQWVQDQSTANLETMRHMDEMQSRAMDAEYQLTRRTAELEAANHSAQTFQTLWRESCNQRDELQAELERVRGELATYKETKHDAI